MLSWILIRVANGFVSTSKQQTYSANYSEYSNTRLDESSCKLSRSFVYKPKADMTVAMYKMEARTVRWLGRIRMPREWAITIQSHKGNFFDRRTRYCLAGASEPTFSTVGSSFQKINKSHVSINVKDC